MRGQIARGQDKLDAFPLCGGSTFAEFSERRMTAYVAIAKRASTAEEKRYPLRCRLLPAFGHLRLEEISAGLVDAQAASWIKSGLTVKRVNSILMIFRKALGRAVEWGMLAKAPLIRCHKYAPPIPRFLKREDSFRLLDSMEAGFWRTLVLFLLRASARFGEAAGGLMGRPLDAEPPTVRIQLAWRLLWRGRGYEDQGFPKGRSFSSRSSSSCYAPSGSADGARVEDGVSDKGTLDRCLNASEAGPPLLT